MEARRCLSPSCVQLLEEVGLVSQRTQIAQAVAAVSQHHHQVPEHSAGIVDRAPSPGSGHGQAQPSRHTQS